MKPKHQLGTGNPVRRVQGSDLVPYQPQELASQTPAASPPQFDELGRPIRYVPVPVAQPMSQPAPQQAPPPQPIQVHIHQGAQNFSMESTLISQQSMGHRSGGHAAGGAFVHFIHGLVTLMFSITFIAALVWIAWAVFNSKGGTP